MKDYFLLFFIFLLNSCIQNESSKQAQETLIFDVGMPVSASFSGVFFDKKDKKEYFYFANPNTSKNIKIFTYDNQLKYTIPLNILRSKKEKIGAIDIISSDTIIILSEYSNKLFYLNKKGEIWREKDLTKIISSNNIFELYAPPWNKWITNNNAILLHIDFRYQFKGSDSVLSFNEQTNLYYNNTHKTPFFVKITNLFEDSLSYHIDFKLYQHLFPSESNVLLLETDKFISTDNYLYANSLFSNKILKIDHNTFKVLQEFEIKSEKTPTFHPLLSTKETNLYQNKRMTEGYIKKMYYNKMEEKFYLVVLKKIEEHESYTEKGFSPWLGCRPWVMMVYDKDFNKLNEREFNNTDYKDFILNTHKGLFILKQNANNTENYYDKKAVFERYIF